MLSLSIESIFHSEILVYITLFLLCFLCICIMFSKSTINIAIYFSLFSLFSVLVYLLTNSPDVAMTEACLGAGFSTAVTLSALKKIKKEIASEFVLFNDNNFFIASRTYYFLLIYIAVIYFGKDLVSEESLENFHQSFLNNYYINNTDKDIGITSIVAAILASYRGYDTMLETLVILIAGICCYVILRHKD